MIYALLCILLVCNITRILSAESLMILSQAAKIKANLVVAAFASWAFACYESRWVCDSLVGFELADRWYGRQLFFMQSSGRYHRYVYI